MQDKTKVAIIGAGGVGTTAALLLAMRADLELVVVDIPGGPAAGRLTDLNQAGKLLGFEPDHLGTHDYSEIAGARVVVITAGSPRSGSSSREALLDGNLGVVRGAAREVRKYAPDAVVIVVTNPVEPHCHAVVTATGFPPERVIGMAQLVDAARFATFVATECGSGVSPHDVQGSVAGRHSDDFMVPLPSQTRVHGRPLAEYLRPDQITRVVAQTREGGRQILRMLPSGSTVYLPAAAIVSMVAAVLADVETVLPCTVFHRGQNGVVDLYMGGEAVLGQGGVHEVRAFELAADEDEQIRRAADDLRILLTRSRIE